MNDEIKFILKSEKIPLLKTVINSLVKIEKKFKFRFEDDKLLVYCSEKIGNQTVALKIYYFMIEDFFNLLIEDEDELEDEFTAEDEKVEEKFMLNFNIGDGKILNKKLNFFTEEKHIKGIFKTRPIDGEDYVRTVKMTDSRFKMSLTGIEKGEISEVSVDIMDSLTDTNNADFKLDIPFSTFDEAKKLSAIDKEDVIVLEVKNGGIYFSQSEWELKVGQTEVKENRKFPFKKNYLKSVNTQSDVIEIFAFSSYLLFKNGNEFFVLSYEKTF